MARGLRCIVAAMLAVAVTAYGHAAEKFRRLTGAQIQSRFAGMELSDDVHWRDLYGRDGTLTSQSMGKQRTGKWRVENNQLCLDLGADSGGCYEVWLAGNNVEFRREGLDGSILEGKIGKPGSTTRGTR
jgi:hypothetical protein